MRVHGTNPAAQPLPGPSGSSVKGNGEDFSAHLGQECLRSVNNAATESPPPPSSLTPAPPTAMTAQSTSEPGVPLQKGLAAYQAQKVGTDHRAALSSLEKYTDDQFLNNPGADRYDLHERKVEPQGSRSFAERVGKDVKDAWANIRNCFANLFGGAKFCYRDENNQIQEGRKKGLLGSVVDCFKDLGSALSFGAWRPDGDPAPQGGGGRIKYAASKLFKAVSVDLLQNVPGSVNHMVEDVALAGLNLVETVPDAVIGSLPGGEKAVSKVFDGGQILINYTTDVAPGGEGWQRVHALSFKDGKPPILNNLSKPERATGDSRWQYVRNTPFRKSLETVGTILADILTFGFVRWIGSSSERTRHKN